jgi:hypothetical protein
LRARGKEKDSKKRALTDDKESVRRAIKTLAEEPGTGVAWDTD